MSKKKAKLKEKRCLQHLRNGVYSSRRLGMAGFEEENA
jgi:hypothetical protein